MSKNKPKIHTLTYAVESNSILSPLLSRSLLPVVLESVEEEDNEESQETTTDDIQCPDPDEKALLTSRTGRRARRPPHQNTISWFSY